MQLELDLPRVDDEPQHPHVVRYGSACTVDTDPPEERCDSGVETRQDGLRAVDVPRENPRQEVPPVDVARERTPRLQRLLKRRKS